jgi:large subunit ribosomal protein L17
MRHAKRTFKLNRNTSHRRCLIANMLKSLIEHERIETTVAKAKELRRHADQMITLAKKGTLSSRRAAIARLMISYNPLTPKEARKTKEGDQSFCNIDSRVIGKLFGPLKDRFISRPGGYTRILKKDFRAGDSAPNCYLEFLPAEDKQ